MRVKYKDGTVDRLMRMLRPVPSDDVDCVILNDIEWRALEEKGYLRGHPGTHRWLDLRQHGLEHTYSVRRDNL